MFIIFAACQTCVGFFSITQHQNAKGKSFEQPGSTLCAMQRISMAMAMAVETHTCIKKLYFLPYKNIA